MPSWGKDAKNIFVAEMRVHYEPWPILEKKLANEHNTWLRLCGLLYACSTIHIAMKNYFDLYLIKFWQIWVIVSHTCRSGPVPLQNGKAPCNTLIYMFQSTLSMDYICHSQGRLQKHYPQPKYRRITFTGWFWKMCSALQIDSKLRFRRLSQGCKTIHSGRNYYSKAHFMKI